MGADPNGRDELVETGESRERIERIEDNQQRRRNRNHIRRRFLRHSERIQEIRTALMVIIQRLFRIHHDQISQ